MRMAKYVSEERLKQIAHETHDSDDGNLPVLSLLDMLIAECKEPNPWMTLDEFLKSGYRGLCWVVIDKNQVEMVRLDITFKDIKLNMPIQKERITHVQPIHKPEPPR